MKRIILLLGLVIALAVVMAPGATGEGPQVPPQQCRDGDDNDGDGLIDFVPPPGYQADPGCSGTDDNDEYNAPPPPPPPPDYDGETINAPYSQGYDACGGSSGSPGSPCTYIFCSGAGTAVYVASGGMLYFGAAMDCDAPMAMLEVQFCAMRQQILPVIGPWETAFCTPTVRNIGNIRVWTNHAHACYRFPGGGHRFRWRMYVQAGGRAPWGQYQTTQSIGTMFNYVNCY